MAVFYEQGTIELATVIYSPLFSKVSTAIICGLNKQAITQDQLKASGACRGGCVLLRKLFTPEELQFNFGTGSRKSGKVRAGWQPLGATEELKVAEARADRVKDWQQKLRQDLQNKRLLLKV